MGCSEPRKEPQGKIIKPVSDLTPIITVPRIFLQTTYEILIVILNIFITPLRLTSQTERVYFEEYGFYKVL